MTQPYLFYSQDFMAHLTAGHPESPQRLRAIFAALEEHGLRKHLREKEPQAAPLDFIQRIHQPTYIRHFELFCQQAGDGTRIDEDTVVSTRSYAAALKAAGAAIDMVKALEAQHCQTAFALVRPPGHHAMPHYTMGFCFFNNAALAALYALEVLGMKRVAILDWDAHHGNGTEYIFYRDPRVFTLSWHQDPNWPGTGKLEELGEGPGWGYNLNIPLPTHYGDVEYLRTFHALVAPALKAFEPELILVAAGYDAHFADPLTQMGLTASGFAALTEALMQTAEDLRVGQVGFLLEGGYHVQALANSVTATLQTLLNEQAQPFAEDLGLAPDLDAIALEPLIERIILTHPLFKKELLA